MRKPNHIPVVSDIVTASGTRKKPIYTPRFDGECISLRVTGSIDIQDSINSFAPYCDLRYMLTRLKAGDTSVLSSRSPSYGDFSGLPGNPVDTLNLINDVQRAFSSLPDEVRLSCNNDWRVYFTRLCAGDFDGPTGVPSDVSSTDPVSSGVTSTESVSSESVKEV